MDSAQPSESVSMEKVCKRYRQLYAGAIYDVLESLGYPNQALSHHLVPLIPDMKLAGPAFTMKGTTTCEKDEAGRFVRMKMVNDMTYPCVEVRDQGTPYHVALYGELSATASRAHGAVGALIDGGTRDTGRLISAGFPVFARYRTPVEAFGRYKILDCQVPVRISGELADTIEVNPGDFIFGDFDGVLVIPKALTLQVLTECERTKELEDLARPEFARGDDPVEVFKRYRKF